MGETDEQALIDRYIAAYNAFDIDGLMALLAPDVRFENYSGAELTASADGVAEFRSLAEHAAALFDEREQRVLSTRTEGPVTVVEIAYRGRFAADVPDGPAAGSVIELTGRSEFEFRDGLIARVVDRS
ncbi:nuclear transport factor 2 family protein [Nocardia goodfellowii]|uniref:Steroid delta-isomerase-like uncharacterized protein n=1 Tax=Nocardia goodfellowii TaxID=882446 RepID=A0ABS4Q9S2_9NOCA|nr:nuclear transport factor 2 family protein [Nocardia goodfellowii]MBP2188440.1 steroid delta-isomerase-like uncharacterized protein [Nocardia goodfellowii]